MRAIKYLYKYVYKGPDRAVVKLTVDNDTTTKKADIIDEINVRDITCQNYDCTSRDIKIYINTYKYHVAAVPRL